jgi:small subunit ribosomal protein S5
MGHSKDSKKDSKDVKDNNTDGLNEELIRVSRVAKTTKGGRTFAFQALTAVGDGLGRLGIGFGKSGEVPVAIQKAMENARKNMVLVELKGDTIFREIKVKYGATKVFMKPAAPGTGLIAGGAMRAVFEVLGVKNILAKTYGSTNPVNVVRATMKALQQLSSPEAVAEKRGKTVVEILGEVKSNDAQKTA